VDYRGFASLSRKQEAQLNVSYALGTHSQFRNFQRKIKGSYEGDFIFHETLGAGLLKRIGCDGETPQLNVNLTLSIVLVNTQPEALFGLDSLDGTSTGGLVYHFDLKKCH
jgi:hypothetical protein